MNTQFMANRTTAFYRKNQAKAGLLLLINFYNLSLYQGVKRK